MSRVLVLMAAFVASVAFDYVVVLAVLHEVVDVHGELARACAFTAAWILAALMVNELADDA